MKSLKNYLLIGLLASSVAFVGCSDDDAPAEENEEEVITSVTLTFTPDGGGTPVVATYLDADGEETGDPVLSEINLSTQTTYTLSILMANTLETPAEDITAEVEAEGDEHQIFYSWTSGVFSDPSGTGNIGATGTVNYATSDLDENGNPVGLTTTWTTTDVASSGGDFRLLLKHQPGVKTSTSTSSDGETDIDITWTINVQ